MGGRSREQDCVPPQHSLRNKEKRIRILRVEFFDHGLIDWWLVALVEGVQWILPVETGLPDRQGGRKMKRFGPVGQGGMRQMKQ